jgi:eukaryotic-like serine/threonine-protein kinase
MTIIDRRIEELYDHWCDLVNDRVGDCAPWRDLAKTWKDDIASASGTGEWPLKKIMGQGMRLTGHQGECATYVIRRRIGAGGNGSVYLCDASGFHAPVAIKTCNNRRQVPDLFREARLLARRRFPNVVRLFGVDHVTPEQGGAGLPIMIMDYLSGGNLYHRQKQVTVNGGTMSLPEAAGIVGRIALGVSASQCVHRDLKPENILFDAAGRPHLTDYGVALPMVISERVRFQYRFNKVVGTPGYMSPEQIVNTYHLDQRSDVYALGLMLFELVTGRMAFEPQREEPLLGYARRTVKEEPPYELVTNATCRQVVERCLAKEPARRFVACEELYDALDPVVRGIDIA